MDEYSSLSKRISYILTEYNLNKRQLSIIADVSAQTIADILDETQKSLKPEKLKNISEKLDIKIEWLAYGIGFPPKHSEKKENAEDSENDYKSKVDIKEEYSRTEEPQEGYNNNGNVITTLSSDDIKKMADLNFNLSETIKLVTAQYIELTNEIRSIYKGRLEDKENINTLMRELYTAKEKLRKKSG